MLMELDIADPNDVADRQYCLVHLLRELEEVDQRNASAAWQAFAKTLRRLLRDGIRLRKRPDFSPQKYQSRILRLGRRLDALLAAGTESATPHAPGSPGARAAAACSLPADVFVDADVTYQDIDPYVAAQNTSGSSRLLMWDAENRLMSVGPVVPQDGDTQVTFSYDYKGRRVGKKVYNWVVDPNDPQWVLSYERKFIWSGWLMLMETKVPG